MTPSRRIMVGIILVLSGMASLLVGANGDQGQEEYLAVLMDGRKVGHAVHTRTVSAGRVTSTETIEITLTRGGAAVSISAGQVAVETVEGRPISFEVDQKLGTMMGMSVKGTVTAGGKLEIDITTGTVAQKRTMAWPEGALLSEGLRLLQQDKVLKQGSVIKAEVFDCTMLAGVKTEMRIGPSKMVDLLGRVVKLTEVESSMVMPNGTMNAVSYVDAQGNALKTTMSMMGMDVELIACNREYALSENDVLDLLKAALLDSPVPLKKASSAKSITYKLQATGEDRFFVPTGDNQRVHTGENGIVTVMVESVAPLAGVVFPYRGNNPAALAALEPTRFLQCEQPEIIKLAQQAVGDTKDAAEAVRRIERFVGDYIHEKSFSVGYASAVEVAASRQGDCTEHAVLSAALCRAVGIPAEVVSGVAYIDEFVGRRNVFGPHAWNRAWVGDRWIGFDATGVGGGFGPGRIALACGNGSPEGFFDILFSLGRFRIVEAVVKE